MDPEELDRIYGGYTKAYKDMPDASQVGRNLRVIGGRIVKETASMPAMVPVAYDLLDTGVRYATDNMDKSSMLPGVESARAATKAIDDKTREWGEAVAGEKLIDGFLENPDPVHQLANWTSVFVSPIPVAGVAVKGMQAARRLVQVVRR